MDYPHCGLRVNFHCNPTAWRISSAQGCIRCRRWEPALLSSWHDWYPGRHKLEHLLLWYFFIGVGVTNFVVGWANEVHNVHGQYIQNKSVRYSNHLHILLYRVQTALYCMYCSLPAFFSASYCTKTHPQPVHWLPTTSEEVPLLRFPPYFSASALAKSLGSKLHKTTECGRINFCTNFFVRWNTGICRDAPSEQTEV